MRLIGCLLILFLAASRLCAQSDEVDDMKLSQEVFELQQQLAGASISSRDEAEKKLIALGVAALDFLPPIDETLSSDLRVRLVRIRSELENQAVIAVTRPSQFAWVGDLNLADLLKELKKQTGNEVVLAESIGDTITSHVFNLEKDENNFWAILDRIQSECRLVVDSYGSKPNQLTLASDYGLGQPVGSQNVVAYSGVLRFELTRIDATRDLLEPARNRTTYSMRIRWEPRLRPISIDLPLSTLKIVDEFDKQYTQVESADIEYGIVQPEIPELEYAITSALLDRQVEELKSFSGVVTAVLPGRIESFEFNDVAGLTEEAAQLKAGATVTFRGTSKNEDLFGIKLSLSFEEENNALESHQSWAYQNEAFLLTKTGERIDYISSETYQQTNNELGMLYLFSELPADAKLVYRTPAAIVKVQIPFELLKIKLP